MTVHMMNKVCTKLHFPAWLVTNFKTTENWIVQFYQRCDFMEQAVIF
jgi:hypothetical protein